MGVFFVLDNDFLVEEGSLKGDNRRSYGSYAWNVSVLRVNVKGEGSFDGWRR